MSVTPAPLPRTVLVVDDNRDAVLLLCRVLQRWGHTVHTAHDGARAIEQVRQHQPDVVLLDIGLPDMNGYEVAQTLHALPFRGTLVALTGYGQDEDLARSRDMGFAHHLLKPVDLGALKGLLEGP
jgi:CheY-like chemotaxis protein